MNSRLLPVSIHKEDLRTKDAYQLPGELSTFLFREHSRRTEQKRKAKHYWSQHTGDHVTISKDEQERKVNMNCIYEAIRQTTNERIPLVRYQLVANTGPSTWFNRTVSQSMNRLPFADQLIIHVYSASFAAALADRLSMNASSLLTTRREGVHTRRKTTWNLSLVEQTSFRVVKVRVWLFNC